MLYSDTLLFSSITLSFIINGVNGFKLTYLASIAASLSSSATENVIFSVAEYSNIIEERSIIAIIYIGKHIVASII
jgi:hypothetical protein